MPLTRQVRSRMHARWLLEVQGYAPFSISYLLSNRHELLHLSRFTPPPIARSTYFRKPRSALPAGATTAVVVVEIIFLFSYVWTLLDAASCCTQTAGDGRGSSQSQEELRSVRRSQSEVFWGYAVQVRACRCSVRRARCAHSASRK